MDKPMKVAEEVFLMVRDLSVSRDGHFRFRDYREAYASTRGRSYKWQGKHHQISKICGIDLVVSRMVEAQLRGGTIKRMARGVYKFKRNIETSQPSHPLYLPR